MTTKKVRTTTKETTALTTAVTTKKPELPTRRDVEVLKYFGNHPDAIKFAVKQPIPKELGTKNPYRTMKKLEKMGIIEGFVPLLTEKGAKIVEAVELLDRPSHQGLEEIFKED